MLKNSHPALVRWFITLVAVLALIAGLYMGNRHGFGNGYASGYTAGSNQYQLSDTPDPIDTPDYSSGVVHDQACSVLHGGQGEWDVMTSDPNDTLYTDNASLARSLKDNRMYTFNVELDGRIDSVVAGKKVPTGESDC